MKIAHLGAWNRNAGDWVLGAALHHEFERIAGEKIKWNLVDSQNTLFDEDTINTINQENDGLLVGGGGLMFWRREDNPISGWQFNITIDHLKKLTLPWGVYAVGLNVFPYDDQQFPNITPDHINATIMASDFFSVRNHGSLKGLQKLGVDTSSVKVIPDSGMFCRDLVTEKNNPIGKPYILLNWASDRPHFRYPEPHEDNLNRCIELMGQALKKVVSDTGHHVLMVPHISELDKDVTCKLKAILGDSFSSTEDTHPHLYPATAEGVGETLNFYKQADLVVGQRGHAGIIAYGLDIPFLYFGNHNKLKYFAQDIEHPQGVLTFENHNDYQLDTIVQRISECLKGESKAQKPFDHFQQLSDSYISSILKLFRQENS